MSLDPRKVPARSWRPGPPLPEDGVPALPDEGELVVRARC